jgi:hypothetical protein
MLEQKVSESGDVRSRRYLLLFLSEAELQIPKPGSQSWVLHLTAETSLCQLI